MEKEATITCFMCETDFRYELGSSSGGCKLYPSKEDCIKYCKCTNHETGGTCGIVEVEVKLVRLVQKDNHRSLCK
jgi:hypothetical protein